MKIYTPVRILMCLLLYTFLPGTNVYSQCADASHFSTLSYDTLFRGSGNSNYDHSFPQFDSSKIRIRIPQMDPSKGTLVEVDIESIINVKYTYKLENLDTIATGTIIKIQRSDTINSSALNPFLESFLRTQITTPTLSASDSIKGSGQDYMEAGPLYAFKKKAIDFVLTENLAGFLGIGEILFNYSTGTDIFANGTNKEFSSTAEDSVYFKLTYKFCLTSILPADISNFTALKSSGKIQLSWSSPNDHIGNRYEMQKSTDGKNFTTFETIISKSGASNIYQVIYTTTGDDKNKVFFRIKQFEADGSVKYSSVKAVDLDYTATTMKVYPTVIKNDFNIYFPYAAKGDYQVSIVSITGQVMQQSVFTRTNSIKVILNTGIQTGMYIVSVVNKQTSEKQQSKILIQ